MIRRLQSPIPGCLGIIDSESNRAVVSPTIVFISSVKPFPDGNSAGILVHLEFLPGERERIMWPWAPGGSDEYDPAYVREFFEVIDDES